MYEMIVSSEESVIHEGNTLERRDEEQRTSQSHPSHVNGYPNVVGDVLRKASPCLIARDVCVDDSGEGVDDKEGCHPAQEAMFFGGDEHHVFVD